MKWSPWHTLVWLVWFVAFLAYESWAGLDHDSRTPMLTQATVRYVPWYVTLSFILWLFIHFAVRYSNHPYILRLRAES